VVVLLQIGGNRSRQSLAKWLAMLPAFDWEHSEVQDSGHSGGAVQ
jgi:hypothetical protein